MKPHQTRFWPNADNKKQIALFTVSETGLKLFLFSLNIDLFVLSDDPLKERSKSELF